MDSTSRRRRVNPRALVGKIMLFNGVVFVAISMLLGGYTLFSHMGTTSTGGNSISMVTGLLALIFAGVGLLEGLVGLVVWLLPGGDSPPANVVNRYYAALENQDYSMAFQYLDPSMGGPLGQMITQAGFIERAQAYDAEHGRITNYSLAGVQANPSKRVFTIKVTRGSGASYRTQLRLTKQGYDWKIVGFDRF
jgi:hypothetical protein